MAKAAARDPAREFTLQDGFALAGGILQFFEIDAGIDPFGLDEMDKRLLEALLFKFAGGPVGLTTLAVAVSEEPETIEEVYEPYLIQEVYLKRTPQGRVATELCYQRFGLKPLPRQGELL